MEIMSLFILVACSLLLSSIGESVAVKTCQSPTRSSPLSLCAFCSDEHAGIRWIAHRYGVISVRISFTCTHQEGNLVHSPDNDPCFGGDVEFSPETLRESGRVHMILSKLRPGTNCVFTAQYTDSDLERREPVLANCSVKSKSQCLNDPEECYLPANCSAMTSDDCQCSCTEGYEYSSHQGGSGIVCENVDECSEEPSPCSDNALCTDTEGSYLCTCSTSSSHVNGSTHQCSPYRDNNLTSESPSMPLIQVTQTYQPSSTMAVAEQSISMRKKNINQTLLTSYSMTEPTTTNNDGLANNEGTNMMLIMGSLAPILIVLLCALALTVFGVTFRTSKQRKRGIKHIATQLSVTSNDLDPEFYPVKVEESLTIKMSAFSILHALERENSTECSTVDDIVSCNVEELKSDNYSETESENEIECSSNRATSADSSLCDHDECQVTELPTNNCISEQNASTIHAPTDKLQPERQFQPLTWGVHIQEVPVSSPCSSGYVTQSSVESSVMLSPSKHPCKIQFYWDSGDIPSDSVTYKFSEYVSHTPDLNDNETSMDEMSEPLQTNRTGYITDSSGFNGMPLLDDDTNNNWMLTDDNNSIQYTLFQHSDLQTKIDSGSQTDLDKIVPHDSGKLPDDSVSIDSVTTVHFDFPALYPIIEEMDI